MPRQQERYCAGLVRDALKCAGYLENYRFDFLRGDPTSSLPRGSKLPVDAYYPEANLILEFRESQHYKERSELWDKRITATGEKRKQQRLRYDVRREKVLPSRGISLLIVYDYQLTGDYEKDLEVIRKEIKKLK